MKDTTSQDLSALEETPLIHPAPSVPSPSTGRDDGTGAARGGTRGRSPNPNRPSVHRTNDAYRNSAVAAGGLSSVWATLPPSPSMSAGQGHGHGNGCVLSSSSSSSSSSLSFSVRRAIVLGLVVVLVVILALAGERASSLSKSSLSFSNHEGRYHARADDEERGEEEGHEEDRPAFRPCVVYGSREGSDGATTETAKTKPRVVQTSLGEPSRQWGTVSCRHVLHRHNGDKVDAEEGEDADDDQDVDGSRYASPSASIRVGYTDGPAFPNRPPILGFGGAFTEATALNYNSLNDKGRDAILRLLFGSDVGLGYTLGRVHMNSCDFCVQSYSFDETENDFDLVDFDSGVSHDVSCGMVDLMKSADYVSRASWPLDGNVDGRAMGRKTGVGMRIVASPWSPPTWMKAPTWDDPPNATHSLTMTGSALPTCIRNGTGPDSLYARSWALYFQKFITAYKNLGISLYGITPQNEPEFPAPWDACAHSPETERDFIGYHLGPLLRTYHPDVKLFMFDHNKDHAPRWSGIVLDPDGPASRYVDGTAVHWYAGGMDRLLDGAVGSPNMHRLFSDVTAKKDGEGHLIIGSEACHCPSTAYAGGDLRVGWDRAERYAHTILADLAAGSNGWIEWNMVLDAIGGPNHLGNMCDAPLLAVPYRARGASPDVPETMPFEHADHPFGPTVGDKWTREELNARGVPAEFLDVGVVVQPMFYYAGHVTRHVRPGSRAVQALVDEASTSVGDGGRERTFRRRQRGGDGHTSADTVVAGGGINANARDGMEITAWPCEGSTRQEWTHNGLGQLQVFGHDWLGEPTTSCLGNVVNGDFRGMLLAACKSNSRDRKDPFGIFEIVPKKEEEVEGQNGGGAPGVSNIVLTNGDTNDRSQSCIVLRPLENNGGAYGPRGGAQINIGSCDDPAAEWYFNVDTGEIISRYYADHGGDVCLTTGWPFLQAGAFVTPNAKDGKAVVLLNEAAEGANYVLRDGDGRAIMSSSIPARSIQTILFD